MVIGASIGASTTIGGLSGALRSLGVGLGSILTMYLANRMCPSKKDSPFQMKEKGLKKKASSSSCDRGPSTLAPERYSFGLNDSFFLEEIAYSQRQSAKYSNKYSDKYSDKYSK